MKEIESRLRYALRVVKARKLIGASVPPSLLSAEKFAVQERRQGVNQHGVQDDSLNELSNQLEAMELGDSNSEIDDPVSDDDMPVASLHCHTASVGYNSFCQYPILHPL